MDRVELVSVELTENFELNLDAIARFLRDASVDAAFERLLDRLELDVVATLERFPRIGRRFLEHQVASVEAVARVDRFQRWALAHQAEFFEFLFDDYLILYALTDTVLYLLAIRHHRQLSFDLKLFW